MSDIGRFNSSRLPSSTPALYPASRSPVNRPDSDARDSRTAREAPISPSRQLPNIDRSQVDPKILEAAEGMEAMFIDYMMKVMRQTVPKNDLDLESPATEIYRSMMDSENSKRAAHAGGVGLSDQIIAYLHGRGYHGGEGHAAPAKEKP